MKNEESKYFSKMIMCVFIAAFLFGCGGGSRQNQNTTTAVSESASEKKVAPQCLCFPVDTARLNRAYRELCEDPGSLERQKDFFYAFPSTSMEFFISNYCFMISKNNSTIYPYVNAFRTMLPLIPDTIYCDKLINLCIGGKWDADALCNVPGCLQHHVRDVMSQKPQVMFSRLSKQTRGFQLRFWQFYWSSLHKVDNAAQCQRLKNMFIRTMPDEVKIMEIGCEFATEEFEMHYPYSDFPHLEFPRKKDRSMYVF